MGWRLAASLETLRAQVNAAAPGRAKQSDGTIGDAAHAARGSAHMPDANGYVTALDITHDPAGGCDSYALADVIAQSVLDGTETRVSGLGSYNVKTGSERWFGLRNGVWSWRDQNLQGANHATHLHVSVHHDDRAYLSTDPWTITARPAENGEDMPLNAEDLAKIAATVRLVVDDELDRRFVMKDDKGTIQKNGLLFRLAGMIRRDEARK